MKVQPEQSEKKSFLRRVGRIGVLLGIKESYLFCRNLLGLGMHPYRTLRAMFREKDRSQQLLVLSLPGYLLLGGLVMIVMGRMLIGAPRAWGWLAKLGAVGVVGAAGLSGVYILFWLVKMWKTARG